MISFFFLVIFFWMFISIFADIFRRDDISGWAKAGWIFFIIILPFLGILIYVIARPKMTEQDKQMMEEYEEKQRRAAGYSSTDEIAKAHDLLDKGAITQAEFDEIKAKALK
jgi:predicted membrane channel-forming protein YqfA (hemolysin III family)